MPLTRIVCIILLLSACVEAANTRGLYGELGVSYEQQSRSSKYGTTDRNTFLENYSMGYAGYIYSPLLLMYDLEGTLYYEDTDITANGYDQSKEVKGREYDVDFRFIQKTDYPFRIYAIKTERPNWDISPNRTYYLDENIERYGLEGLVRMELLDLRYSAEASDLSRLGTDEEEEREDKRYMLTLDKRMPKSYASVNYIYHTQERDRTVFASGFAQQDTVTHTSEATNELNARYDWTISPTLQLNSWARYHDSNISNFVDKMGYAALRWQPNKRYTGSIDTTVNSYESDSGEAKVTSLRANSDYSITQYLSTDQSVSMTNSSGDFGEYASEYYKAGLRLNQPMAEGLTFRADGYVSLNTEVSEFNADLNRTDWENDILTYSVGSGISQYYNPLKGTFSFDARYYKQDGTFSESTDRISLNSLFTARPRYNVNYTLSLNYAKTYRDFSNSLEHNNTGEVTSDLYSANAGVKYWKKLNIKGKVTAEAGVTHVVLDDSTGNSSTRTLPNGSADLRYRFIRNLLFTARGSVYHDVQGETTNYTAQSNVNWHIRQTTVSLRALYREQFGGPLGGKEESRFFMEVRRRF